MAAVDHDLPTLRSFTVGLRRDIEAVTAGLTQPYNSGAVEGTVNKIKAQDAAVRTREARPAQNLYCCPERRAPTSIDTRVTPRQDAPRSLKSPRRSDGDGTQHTQRLDAVRSTCSHRAARPQLSQDHQTCARTK